MAFVIVSTRALAESRLRTVRARTLLAVMLVVAAGLLAGGAALGFRLGQQALADAAGSGPVPFDPARPEDRAVIERVGSISGRLMRLEGEALRLAQRLGLQQSPGAAAGPLPAQQPDGRDLEPSGGPLVLPLATPGGALPDNFSSDLGWLAEALARVEGQFAMIAEAAALRDLDRMAIPSQSPIPGGHISSGFGNRRDPFTNRLARHTGVDIPARHGAPIYASAGGRVRYAGFRGAYGRTVEIDHGKGLVTRYGHASRLFVQTGDVVLPGQRIAAVGSSGRSTGPHLHFEVLRDGHQVEPRMYLARNDR